MVPAASCSGTGPCESRSFFERCFATTVPVPTAEATLSKLLAWGTKGSLAILDQGLFAWAHFLLSILLARWLTPTEYGAFALAYSIFLLFGAFHTALLTEPMMVFGAVSRAE